jgi:hypothetical protein
MICYAFSKLECAHLLGKIRMLKKTAILLSAILLTFGGRAAASNTPVVYYQNYAGSCSNCNSNPCACPPVCSAPSCQAPCPPLPDPCSPCAPVYAAECGVSICAIGAAVLAIVGAAALILSSQEPVTEHAH